MKSRQRTRVNIAGTIAARSQSLAALFRRAAV
jgi:hypothetical protein